MHNKNHMLHRMQGWDYRQRCIYMVTLTVADRRPLLGKLVGGLENPSIELSDIGKMVASCWQEIPLRYPGVSLMEWQVMPEHFHGIVFVEIPQKQPLGTIIGSFKAHTSSLYQKMIKDTDNDKVSATKDIALSKSYLSGCAANSLWSPGFQDTILMHRGQLVTMRAYIIDNPRRLAIKKACPELFRVVNDLRICGCVFSAIGNKALLDVPLKRQVQLSRSLPLQSIHAHEKELLSIALGGAVLVSPRISSGEKQVIQSALRAELPLIILQENGFPELYKPPKEYFEACAAGRLLILAPWPYHADRRKISREQCLALNEFARKIADNR